MIKTKKTLKASFLSLMIMAAFHISAADIFALFDQVESRCKELPLSHSHAIKKVRWAFKCKLINGRQYDLFLNDDYGNPRDKAVYPLFFLQEENQITSTYIEEQRKIHGAGYNILEYSSCNAAYILNKFRLGSCLSQISLSCPQLIQKAYDEGEIDIREKRYLTENNMVPVFDESGYVDGFKLCDTP